MGIKNIFRKKKKEERPVEVKKEIAKKEVRVESRGERKEKIISEAYKILKAPQLTEKATELAQENQYVFKVWPRANKIEIKKAIEDLYGVEVEKVRIINVPKKRRRVGRILGWRKGYKKAIVKIKEGQKIEIMPR